jgi:hypothetical protein
MDTGADTGRSEIMGELESMNLASVKAGIVQCCSNADMLAHGSGSYESRREVFKDRFLLAVQNNSSLTAKSRGFKS